MRIAFLIAALCAVCAAAEPRQLQDLRTWGDLQGQPAIELGGGVCVRLGIEARSCAVGSGVLVYCLSEGFDRITDGDEHSFGPLHLAVKRPYEADGTRMLFETQSSESGGPLLWVYPLDCPRAGLYELQLRRRSGNDEQPGDVLAATSVEAHGERSEAPIIALTQPARRVQRLPQKDAPIRLQPTWWARPGWNAHIPLRSREQRHVALPHFALDELRPDLDVRAEAVGDGWLLHVSATPSLVLFNSAIEIPALWAGSETEALPVT